MVLELQVERSWSSFMAFGIRDATHLSYEPVFRCTLKDLSWLFGHPPDSHTKPG